MAHAAESQHWYDREGRPCYTVIGANGKERPATLRDARKMNLVPGVSSIIKCAAAPGLEIWKAQQVLMAALTLPKMDGEAEADYLKRIMQDSQEQARKARERGTAIHAAIQGWYQGEVQAEADHPYVSAAIKTVNGWGGNTWIAEQPFSSALGFGGKVDLHGSNFVLDFKTKEFDEDADLKTWDEHAMQLAAYRHGLGMEKARCAIVYVSTTVPGLAKLIELSQEELAKGWTMFYSLLHYWQAKNTYRSSFERLAA